MILLSQFRWVIVCLTLVSLIAYWNISWENPSLRLVEPTKHNFYPAVHIANNKAFILQPDRKLNYLTPEGKQTVKEGQNNNKHDAVIEDSGFDIIINMPDVAVVKDILSTDNQGHEKVRFRVFEGGNTLVPLPSDSDSNVVFIFDSDKNIMLKVKITEPIKFKSLEIPPDPPNVYPGSIYTLKDKYLIELTDGVNNKSLWYRAIPKSGYELKSVLNWHNKLIKQLAAVKNDALVITDEDELIRISADNKILKIANNHSQTDTEIKYKNIILSKSKTFISTDSGLFQYTKENLVNYAPQLDVKQLGDIDEIYELGGAIITISTQGIFHLTPESKGLISRLKLECESIDSLRFGGSNKTVQTPSGNLITIAFDGYIYQITILPSRFSWAWFKRNSLASFERIRHLSVGGKDKSCTIEESIPFLQKIEFPNNSNPTAKNIYKTSQGIFVSTDQGLYQIDNDEKIHRVTGEKQGWLSLISAFNDEAPLEANDLKYKSDDQVASKDYLFIETSQGIFQIKQSLPLSLKLANTVVSTIILYCLIATITIRYYPKALAAFMNWPSFLIFWFKYILITSKLYRRWIFGRYVKKSRTESDKYANYSNTFRKTTDSILEILKTETDIKHSKAWIQEESINFIDTIMKDIAWRCFKDNIPVNSPIPNGYIPLIARFPVDKGIANKAESILFDNAEISIGKAVFSTNDGKFLQNLLFCGDFTLIMGPVIGNSQCMELEKLIKESPQTRIVVFSPDEVPDITDWEKKRYSQEPPDIFISYSHEDEKLAKRLIQILEDEKWMVWWDKHLRTGKDWREKLKEELETARSVVVFCTKNSLKSDYVLQEIRIAFKRGKSLGRDILFPVMLEKVDLPFELEGIQGSQLIGWKGNKNDNNLKLFLKELNKYLSHVS